MSQVKLGLDTLSLVDQIKSGRAIVTAMSGNPNFTTPAPPLSDITDAINLAEAAMLDQKARDSAAQQATLVLHNAQLDMTNKLTSLGAYVQNTSLGDALKIKSAGMEIRSDAAPIGALPAPENLSATTGDMPGEIDLHWNRVRGATAYVTQYTLDPLSPGSVWTTCPPSTKSKCTVPGLTAGGRYWFRVAAVGAAGQGPWSDPALRMAQ